MQLVNEIIISAALIYFSVLLILWCCLGTEFIFTCDSYFALISTAMVYIFCIFSKTNQVFSLIWMIIVINTFLSIAFFFSLCYDEINISSEKINELMYKLSDKKEMLSVLFSIILTFLIVYNNIIILIISLAIVASISIITLISVCSIEEGNNKFYFETILIKLGFVIPLLVLVIPIFKNII